jgi:hypothetical protein
MQIRKARLTSSAADWTKERIAQLRKQEIQQLQSNAALLGETGVAELCGEVLKEQPRATRRSAGANTAPPSKKRRLISRGKAFEARGVMLQDPRTSWGGVRKSDGAVVVSLWADAVESSGGGCSYLLWAPNREGSRPWSDSAAGRERLEHCRLAVKGSGAAEGMLVFGERLDGHLPEEKARSVHGIDPETVLQITIEQRGEEYWGIWGKKKPA